MNLGFLQFLFAGVPADMACILISTGRLLGTKVGIGSLAGELGPSSDQDVKRSAKWFLLKIAGQL